jgi:hypothetical protein
MNMRAIGIAMLEVMGLGCGAAGSEMLADGNEVEAPVDIEGLKSAPVSLDEAEIIQEFLASRSADAPSFEGRIARWDDAWTTVDDLLFQAESASEARLVDKAYVDTVAANPVNSTTIEWFRPDTQRQHSVIIQDDAPQFFFDAFNAVAQEYMAVQNNDCIATNTWVVMRQSTFNQLPASSKAQTYEITINYVPITTPGWPCGAVPNGPKACARFPAAQNVTVFTNGAFVNVTRLALGPSMHFDSGNFSSADIPKLKRTIRHELGHNLGLAHQVPSNILVPGTQTCGQCFSEFDSVMRSTGRDTFTSDDILTLKTLYMDSPNRANDGCSYVNGFRQTTAFL